MDNLDISSKVLAKIKETKPKPKWQFLLKDSLIWLFVFLSLMVGSFASSVVIYMIDNNHWDLYEQISGSFLRFLFATLPYFWIIILSGFVALLYYNFASTKSGYKFNHLLVVMSSIFISIILGLIFYNVGLAQIIDNIFEEKMPLYSHLQNHKQYLAQPDKGILAGKILIIYDNGNFKLLDFNQKEWEVIPENIPTLEMERYFMNMRIIAMGRALDQQTFAAYEIRPFARTPKTEGCEIKKCLKLPLPFDRLNERFFLVPAYK
jgi:hypothetical protein